MTLPLKEYYHVEILGGRDKKFSWRKVIRKARRSRRCNFMFWYRMAYVLYRKNNSLCKSISNSINIKLSRRYSVEIMLGAEIDEGLRIPHNIGIVITKNAVIGKNFSINQNTSIANDLKNKRPIVIGHNVEVGAHSCILGSNLTIGDNVKIGAMSFVNKNIPANHTFISKKTSQSWPSESQQSKT
ncbi:MAG: hypothetical protein NE334_10600 [Lentisphaeraceae bacterium]|nr:hypothetical protein [Lentisphaeraceae bacterium]